MKKNSVFFTKHSRFSMVYVLSQKNLYFFKNVMKVNSAKCFEYICNKCRYIKLSVFKLPFEMFKLTCPGLKLSV